MTTLVLQITSAGREAMVDTDNGGTRAVQISSVGLTSSEFVAAATIETVPGEFKRIDTVSGTSASADAVHMTVRDDSADTYTVRGIGLYLDTGVLFAVYSQADAILEKTSTSSFYLDIDWQLSDGDATEITFGSASSSNPPATETTAGVAKLATVAESLAGLVSDKIITPATMSQALASYLNVALLGAAGGVATLDANGKLDVAQRPTLDLVSVWPVTSQAAMLALASASTGDFAVRTDSGAVYVLQQAPASTLANWLQISVPAPVTSVNGKVGAVALTASDVGSAPTARKVTTAAPLAGGGNLAADLNLSIALATADEAASGQATDKVLTPASLASVLETLAAKANAGATVSAKGILSGGGKLSDNPTISLAAATADEIVAGTRSDAAVTPAALASLPQSLTPNGFITLPGGFMLMWVQVRQTILTETMIAVSYPTSFKEFAVPVSALGYSAAFSTVRDLWPQLVGAPGLSGCSIQTQSDDASNMRLDGFNLFLLGK